MSDAGRQIRGYRLLTLLGRGAMSDVWRAEHLASGRLVALKTVQVPWAAAVPAIRREIHALSRLRHPGIVQILDSGVEQGVPWYAMELVEGLTLRESAAAQPLPDRTGLARLLGVVRELCLTLAYVHGEGLVHRDLKPDNILLTNSESRMKNGELKPKSNGRSRILDSRFSVLDSFQPVLVDFGVATEFAGSLGREVLSLDAASAGTVLYMAPEQIRGELVDARADLYSLGCVLYEVLVRQPPFQGSAAAVREAHLHREPRPPDELAPWLPAELVSLVLRLLRKDPRARLGYATDVEAALKQLIERGERRAARSLPLGPKARPYLYRPRFVGREPVLASLGLHLDRLAAGNGGLMLIGGESGVGKTRVLLELTREARRRKLRVLAGECPPEAVSAPPLRPLRRPLEAICDWCRQQGSAETERVFGERGAVLAPYEPAVAALPGAPAWEAPALPTSELARRQVLGALGGCLGSYAGARPLLLVLDDLHWADELTLGFLESFAAGGAGEPRSNAPVLVVGTYRSEESGARGMPGLQKLLGLPGVSTLKLQRLQPDALGAMASDMLALDLPSTGFVGFLARQTEGNPFFLAEYLRTAVAEGVLYRDALGRWQVAEPGEEQATDEVYARLPLSGTLHETVARRLEGLGQDARRLLDAGAVLGREMDGAVLRRMLRLGQTRHLEAVTELVRRLVLEESLEGRLRFAHDKIREVAVERLTPRRRKQQHRAAAAALEAQFGSASLEHQAALGHHWQQAGNAGRARACYLAAARFAASRHEHVEAVRLYRACLDLLEPPTAEGAAVRHELARDLLGQGRAAECAREARQALQEARQLGDRAAEGRSLQLLATGCRDQGRLTEARPYLEQALAIARELGDRRAEALALNGLANLCSKLDERQLCEPLYEQSLAAAREVGDRRLETMILNNLAILHLDRGSLDEARALYLQVLALDRENQDRASEGIHLGNLAVVLRDQGRLHEALEAQQQALGIHREVGSGRFEGIAQGNLATLLLRLGRPAEARQLFESALVLHRRLGNRTFEGQVLREQAVLERQTGSLEEAERLLGASDALFRQVGDELELAHSLVERGLLALARGRPARELLLQVRSMTAALGLASEAELGAGIAQLARAQESFDAGRPLFRGQCASDLPEGLRLWLEQAGRLPGAADSAVP